MGIVYFDGQYLPEEEAKVSVLDRGYLSGDGVFTTLKVANGTVHFLSTHLERLKTQCEVVQLLCPQILPQWVKEVVLRNQATTETWKMKIVMSRGESLSMRLPKQVPEHLLIFMKPFQEIPYAPLSMAIFPIPVSTAHAYIKSLSHLNRFCVMEYGRQKGFDDAITSTENGVLLESAFANLIWVRGNEVFVSDQTLPYYKGVTLSYMLKAAENLGYKIRQVKARIDDISSDTHIYRCNTMTGLRPIIEIEGKKFLRNEIFERNMQKEYEGLVTLHSLDCLEACLLK